MTGSVADGTPGRVSGRTCLKLLMDASSENTCVFTVPVSDGVTVEMLVSCITFSSHGSNILLSFFREQRMCLRVILTELHYFVNRLCFSV